MNIFGFKIGGAPETKQPDIKSDKISDVAKSKIAESSQKPSPFSFATKIITWLKAEFWSIINTINFSKSTDKINEISRDKIIPIHMDIHSFDIGEKAAYEIEPGIYKMIEIIGLTVDEDNPEKDFITDLEGNKIPVASLYKLNKIDQTKLIINRAGKSAQINDIGILATPINVKIGDLLVYDQKNILVELKKIDNHTFTVFDSRKLIQLQSYEFKKLKSDSDNTLDQTLPSQEIDFEKEEVKIGEIVAYRYISDNNANTIYKKVRIIEIYPDIIVTNGLTNFIADSKDIFGIKPPDSK